MGEGEQELCLHWNDHQITLVQNFETLLNSGDYTDCILSAEGSNIKVHKVVLSSCSLYFEKLLNEHHDKHPIIILSGIKYIDLKIIVDYMYTGKVIISQNRVKEFLRIIDLLQIKGFSGEKNDNSAENVYSKYEQINRKLSSTKTSYNNSAVNEMQKNKTNKERSLTNKTKSFPPEEDDITR